MSSKRRRSYAFSVTVNGRKFNEVIIDPHYEDKHPDITDELILSLVRLLDGLAFKAAGSSEEWEYFAAEAELGGEGNSYRLVWCLSANDFFLGVINCFRR